MIVVTTAHLSKSDANMLGEINISKINDTITLNGIEYKYLASGLCREVYYSKDTQYVIKIPKQKKVCVILIILTIQIMLFLQ